MLWVILDEQPQSTDFASDVLSYADDASCFLGPTLFRATAPSHASMSICLCRTNETLTCLSENAQIVFGTLSRISAALLDGVPV